MITIKISTLGPAFDTESKQYEVARILQAVAGDIELGFHRELYNDTNGNQCCTVKFTGRDRQ